ncbi:MAG TPA: hypothetical protein VNR39_01565 [Pseudolabrys sp.]|nr:hypothetical protein [Pseudolabrys sp.]
MFQKFCLAIAVMVPLTFLHAPAFAITQKQWSSVCQKHVGLRSGLSRTDTRGAGYGLDDGAEPLECFQAPPPNWDKRLEDTITFMLGFEDAADRYLIMLRPCRGNGGRYWEQRTFPKCPSAGPTVIASTEHTMGSYSVPELIRWVMHNIPE